MPYDKEMIISDKYRFVFIHIPKCAGSYVRNAINCFDDTEGFFENKVCVHKELGAIDYVHITLPILERYFVHEYKKVCDYRSVAILRNPEQRFFSSVSQHLKMKGKKLFHQMNKDEQIECVKSIVQWLKVNRYELIYPAEYIHFMHQHMYIFNNGKRVVKHLYSLEQVDDVFGLISEITEQKVNQKERSFANASFVYKQEYVRSICEPLRPIYDMIKIILPKNHLLKIKKLFFREKDESDCLIKELFWVNDFIRDFYEKDFEIWNEVRINNI